LVAACGLASPWLACGLVVFLVAGGGDIDNNGGWSVLPVVRHLPVGAETHIIACWGGCCCFSKRIDTTSLDLLC